MVSAVVFLCAFAPALGVVFVPAILALGNALLLAKGAEMNRAVGVVVALLGLALAGTVVLSIATAAI